jgi:hypothetical protein
MKEPRKIKLTDAPQTKRVNLTPLPSINESYPEPMVNDTYIKTEQQILEKTNNEDNQ